VGGGQQQGQQQQQGQESAINKGGEYTQQHLRNCCLAMAASYENITGIAVAA
jgi:hypothetical protein